MQIEATFSILTCFSMVFGRNPTRPLKSKQTFQFWSVFEWCLQEIQVGYANRNKLFNFDPGLNGFCRKSCQTTQIEAIFSILTRFWMVFARNPTRVRKSKQTSILTRFWMVFIRNATRPRKSKQPFQFWPGFEWLLQEILPDHANRTNLFNFDPFLNGFCKKSNWASQIEANFSNLTRFWTVFVRNPTSACKSMQTFQFFPFLNEWFLKESY